jgi:DNA ligase 1
MIKPSLACNYQEDKLVFPIGIQPKIDGVRACHAVGMLTGRSLKRHGNKYVTDLFSNLIFAGLDGEMAVADETDAKLCRLTSSALSTIESKPFVTWHLFDYVTEETKTLPYKDRYLLLKERLDFICKEEPILSKHLKVVPMFVVNNLDELNQQDSVWLEQGYEGTICRVLDEPLKENRCSVYKGGFLRIKRFLEEDALVLSVEEGNTNNNPKIVNALGRSERSSHKENKTPNGFIGALICKCLKTGNIIRVSPGCMTDPESLYYFNHPDKIIGKIIKYKHFPKGVKDKPRFPTFHSFRIDSDVV